MVSPGQNTEVRCILPCENLFVKGLGNGGAINVQRGELAGFIQLVRLVNTEDI